MEETIALRVIKEIEKNPGIHYLNLKEKTKNFITESQLYALLYGLLERELILGEETERYEGELVRSVERSKFNSNYEGIIKKELRGTFLFWKLGEI